MTKRQNTEIEKVRHNVQNSHAVNLRDDLDEKFEELGKTVDRGFQQASRRIDALAKRTDSRLKALSERLDAHIDGQ